MSRKLFHSLAEKTSLSAGLVVSPVADSLFYRSSHTVSSSDISSVKLDFSTKLLLTYRLYRRMAEVERLTSIPSMSIDYPRYQYIDTLLEHIDRGKLCEGRSSQACR